MNQINPENFYYTEKKLIRLLTEGRAKIEIALVRGRRLHDKRQAIAKRESEREAERSLARKQRRA